MPNWFYRLSLRRRLWVAFLLLTVLSIALTGTMSYWIAYRSTEQEAFVSSQNTLNKSARVLDEKLRHVIVTASSMMLSESFRLAMEDVYNRQPAAYYARLSSLQIPIAQMKMSEPAIASTLIHTAIGDYYATNDLRNVRVPFESTLFARETEQLSRPLWLPSHADPLFLGEARVISLLMKPITDVFVSGVYVVVNLKEDVIRSVVTDDLVDHAANYFLLSTDGQEVLPLSGKGDALKRDPAFLQKLQQPEGGFFKHKLSGETYLVNHKRLTIADDWTMVVVQSQSDLLAEVNRIKSATLLIMLCCILLALVLSNAMSGFLLKPLHKLQSVMRSVEQNNLEVRFTTKYQDEVAHVGNQFNRMVTEISTLIDEVKEAEHEKRKMEIKALQAQIDPHFLYNTLNTMIWKSELAQNREVTEMIASLSQLFQLGLNNGFEMTTLAKEIEHVREYLKLQQQCYEGLFDFEIELEDETLLERPILKIVLQPFVENAILHGFQGMDSGGRIRITIGRDGRLLRLRVEDNGEGMDARQVDADMRSTLPAMKKGYALRNVFGRLQLYYNGEADIALRSEPYRQTSATVRIPLESEENEDGA